MPIRFRHLLYAALLLALLPYPARSSDQVFEQAYELYKTGQWKPAAFAFDAIATDLDHHAPARHQAQLYAGECLMRVGDYAAARQRYELVRHRAPSPRLESQALFRLGEVAYLTGEHRESERLLRSYTETYPQGESLPYAEDYLQQLEARHTQQASFEVLDRAVGLERVGRFDEAIATYHRLLELESVRGTVRAETLRRSALLHERLAESQHAVELYLQYLDEFPHSKRTSIVMLAVAWNYVRLDQTSQASDHFSQLLAKFPQSAEAAEAAYWLAQHHADDRDEADVLELLEIAIAHPTRQNSQKQLRGKALCLKCQLLASQENWSDIEALVEDEKETVGGGSLQAKLEFWSAEAAFRSRGYKRARQRFADLEPKSIGLDPTWTAMIPLRRAQLATRRQQWSEVLRILDRMENQFPNFPLTYEMDYLRGRALAGRGKMTAARRYYRRVVENPKAARAEVVPMAGWMIGETYFHQRDYPRALAAYELVMDTTDYPEWQSRAALQAGKCWELEQQWEEASRVYAAALQRWPNSFSESQLESRLRWAQNQESQEPSTQTR